MYHDAAACCQMPHDGGWYSQMLTDAARFIKMQIDVPGCRKMHMNTARYCKTPSDAGWYSQILLDATGCIRMFPDSDAHKKRPVIMLLMQLDVSWYHSALWCTCLELHSFGATYTKKFPQLFEIIMLYHQFDARYQTFTLTWISDSPSWDIMGWERRFS